MFRLDSEEALLNTFRPKDRASVELADELVFPLRVRDYVAWAHPGGGRVYLVFSIPGGVPTGICFERSGGTIPVPAMCSWCHCTDVGTGVGMLTATLNQNKRVGILACANLDCREKLEDAANRTGSSVRPAMERLVARMGQFASQALHIDLTGVGRPASP
jgi:hypothetical protein